MSFRRVSGIAAMILGSLLWISCGQVYRPVVIPIANTPPNSSNFHAVFAVSNNVGLNYGTTFQIDVSGDSTIGQANTGINPVHAGILPNNSRVFVASAGSIFAGQGDTVTGFVPAADSSITSGIGTVTTFNLPYEGVGQSVNIVSISASAGLVTATLNAPLTNAKVGQSVAISSVGVTGYNGSYPIYNVSGTLLQYLDSNPGLTPSSGGVATLPVICPYLPDYVTTAQNTAVFVASYGTTGAANCNLPNTDSIALLVPTGSQITNIQYLSPGSHPVAMVETPDDENLYVANQGNNTVSDLSPIDLSPLSAPITVGSMPAWMAVRPDGFRIYVVTQGDGQLYTIRTDTNAIVSHQSVGGPGANYVLYDTTRNRLYVTNPNVSSIYVFDATTDPPTPLGSATGAIPIPAPPACTASAGCGAVVPTGIATIPDGSRFYVASYAVAAGTCPDSTISATGCVIPQVTVFNAAAFTVKTTVFPLLNSAASSGAISFAMPPAAQCAPVTPYSPANVVQTPNGTAGVARFRMFAASSADGSHVYASLCDAGTVADIVTASSSINAGQSNAPDVLASDITAPFGAAGIGTNGLPIPQSPTFLLTGQ